MNWNDTEKACETLGDGWRLPTIEGLNILYQNKVAIGGFASDFYLSSTEFDGFNYVWVQDFTNGDQYGYWGKNYSAYVRAIRAF